MASELKSAASGGKVPDPDRSVASPTGQGFGIDPAKGLYAVGVALQRGFAKLGSEVPDHHRVSKASTGQCSVIDHAQT